MIHVQTQTVNDEGTLDWCLPPCNTLEHAFDSPARATVTPDPDRPVGRLVMHETTDWYPRS